MSRAFETTFVACNLLARPAVESGPDHGPERPSGEWITAGDLMRRVESALHPSDTLARAAERMTALGVRELPVVDGDRLVGIIAQIDLLPYRGHFEWTAVRAAMSGEPVTVGAEALLPAVAALLLERGINSVPVVAGDRLVGMVSRMDLLRPLARHAENHDVHGGETGRDPYPQPHRETPTDASRRRERA